MKGFSLFFGIIFLVLAIVEFNSEYQNLALASGLTIVAVALLLLSRSSSSKRHYISRDSGVDFSFGASWSSAGDSSDCGSSGGDCGGGGD